MIPRLGKNYPVQIEVVSKPNQEYRTEEYASSGLPIAPAIIIGDELLVQGRDIDEEKLEDAIYRHLGLPEPGSQKKEGSDGFSES